jgi:hypothetical protein
MYNKLIIRAFRAPDNPDACQRFVNGHKRVLEDYGVPNVTSGKPTWLDNPNVYVCVAEDEEGNVHGGIRAHIADGKLPLPIETAIGEMDPSIYKLVEKFRNEGGVGELCGLWNSREVAGRGVSLLLTRSGISIINQIHFKTLMGICADYTLPMFRQVGFVIDSSLGLNGEFAYPNPNYITRVLGIMNAETLETANQEDKEVMLQLRTNPEQSKIEVSAKGELLIEYHLKLN